MSADLLTLLVELDEAPETASLLMEHSLGRRWRYVHKVCAMTDALGRYSLNHLISTGWIALGVQRSGRGAGLECPLCESVLGPRG